MEPHLAFHARRACGLSQREFAKLLGVSKSTVEAWESGTEPTRATRALLSLMVLEPDLCLRTLRDLAG